MDLAKTLKALADPNRLRILSLLQGQKLCVCDLEIALELHQSNLSRHLAKLRAANLVEAERHALFVYYSSCQIRGRYAELLEQMIRLTVDDPAFQRDRERLAAIKPGDACATPSSVSHNS